MAVITIWHNPRCSKSRQALSLLQETGAEVAVRRYLEDPPAPVEIEAARDALGLGSLHGMLRSGEKILRELGLDSDASETALLAAMAAHPILIERPIVFAGARAVIGRPPEKVRAIL
ncbi:arsenate reductase (glutaredoxin) [Sulfitobacter alexandrii]|uniref:Arsenate reductase n=1 Tax=Sulfitobacter alexandrii TaxID=1917485 RepID=A0A1J0WEK8_9RHOB|nr:arsenate reductase (glutaredoxin) [Sulfitobacter alexandrii]APE42748.1 arsenate reductase (glutaredoxin) [Sulfitobacter alexandrii]